MMFARTVYFLMVSTTALTAMEQSSLPARRDSQGCFSSLMDIKEHLIRIEHEQGVTGEHQNKLRAAHNCLDAAAELQQRCTDPNASTEMLKLYLAKLVNTMVPLLQINCHELQSTSQSVRTK